MCVRVFMHQNSPWLRVLVPRKGGCILETLRKATWLIKLVTRHTGSRRVCGTGGGAMHAELVMFRRSVFCHMLSVVPVLSQEVVLRLSVASAFCDSLSWEVNKHSFTFVNEKSSCYCRYEITFVLLLL